MSGKIEYLEKYSVAPSPSRDYYGLKVINDKVILYLWRISHGPHKTPLVQTVGFSDFEQDKSLQDEIRRGFGEPLLNHIKIITAGNRKTLLTLPKCLIESLAKYLTVNDIRKLSSLSRIANEVFGDNAVWEIFYKRNKPLKSKNSVQLSVNNWKEPFGEQMQTLTIGENKYRTRSTRLIRTLAEESKSTSKLSSARKKPTETPPKKLVQAALKNPSNSQLDVVKPKNGGFKIEKPLVKTVQSITEKKFTTLSKTEKSNPKSTKDRKKVTKSTTDVKNITNRIMIDSKPTLAKSKSLTTKVKSSKQNRPKTISDSDFLKDSSAVKDRIDLSALIEASMRNVHSPRMFDYSTLERLRSGGGEGSDKKGKTVDISRSGTKSKSRLDRLSEKSQTACKTDGASLGSPVVKERKGRCDIRSANLKKGSVDLSNVDEKDGYFERYGIYGGLPTPRIFEDDLSNKCLEKMEILRSLKANSNKVKGHGRNIGGSRGKFGKVRCFEKWKEGL